MASGVEAVCVKGHFNAERSSNTSCFCLAYYEGPRCETRITWLEPLGVVSWVVHELVVVAIAYWLVLKIAHVVKVDGCRLTKIGHVSLGLLAAGLVSNEALWLLLHIVAIAQGVDLTEAGVAIGVVASLLSACEFALIFSSGSLIIAFWFDGLTRFFRPSLALRAKIATIVGSLLLIGLPVGAILMFVPSTQMLGFIFFFLPYFINVIGLLVIVVIISTIRPAHFSSANRLVLRKTIVLFVTILVGWVLVGFITYGHLFVLIAAPQYRKYFEAAIYCYPVIYFTLFYSILSLNDRHGGYINLTRWAVFGHHVETTDDYAALLNTTRDEMKEHEGTTITNYELDMESSDVIEEEPALTAASASSSSRFNVSEPNQS